jgi:hypothetical protein
VKTRPVEPSIYSQADFAARVLTKEPKTAAQEQLPREGAPPGLRARIEASIGIRRPRVQPPWPALVALIAITATVASGLDLGRILT